MSSQDWASASAPGQAPIIDSIFDFSAEALGQLKVYLEQAGLNLPISNLVGYAPLKDYTPVWTANTTPPALGNGSLTGKYLKIGTVIIGFLSMTFGTTTTQGTGYWRFSYPTTSAVAALVGGSFQLGQAAGLGSAIPVNFSTTGFAVQDTNGAGLVGVGVPNVWAAGDTLNGLFIYVSA